MELCALLRSGSARPDPRVRADLWNLLRDSLLCALRREAAGHWTLSHEDLEDLASTKALDLLSRAERGDWDPVGRTPGEVVNYVRSTVRHGMIRLDQQRSRLTSMDRMTETGVQLEEVGMSRQVITEPSAPERSAESNEFAAVLGDCVAQMQIRARTVWILRAIHEWSSREISRHPEVMASEANVDVILMRARASLRECLAIQGHEPGPLPAGTFTSFWERMRRDSQLAVTAGRGNA